MSGSLTTITVLLIVIFLFREGLGLFTTSPLENHNVIVVNKNNPVEHLTATQIKHIFDQQITNWKDLGGKNDTILLFTINDLTAYFSEEEIGENFEYLPEKLNTLVDSIPNLLAVYTDKYLASDLKGKLVKVDKNNIPDFLFGKEWFPTAEPAVQLGVLPLILGTLLVSIFAILFALPIGIATAIYMAEVANERVRKVLKPIIELLAGIPSVVYGFFWPDCHCTTDS